MRGMNIRIALAVSMSFTASVVTVERAAAQEGSERQFGLQVSEQLTLDDNLYRLPEEIHPADILLGAEASRDDLISSTSVAVEGGWSFSRQALNLDATVDANRFAENDALDNVSGRGRIDWEWRLGELLSGHIGADYARSLAGFANSRFLERDLIETEGYRAELQYRITTRWTLSAQARRTDTSHDHESRRIDDADSRSGVLGAEYRSRAGNVLAWEYRYTEATFPNRALSPDPAFDRDYDERIAGFRVKYALSAKTSLEASTGHVKRDYTRSPVGDFSGGTWTASLAWEPRRKVRIEASAWKQLRAHLDAESDHFVSRGAGLRAAWSPRASLTFSLELSSEDQDYIRTGQEAEAIETTRSDRLRSGQATLAYVSHRGFMTSLSYRLEERRSNRPLFDYDAESIILGVGFSF